MDQNTQKEAYHNYLNKMVSVGRELGFSLSDIVDNVSDKYLELRYDGDVPKNTEGQ